MWKSYLQHHSEHNKNIEGNKMLDTTASRFQQFIFFRRLFSALTYIIVCNAALHFSTATCWTYHYSTSTTNYEQARKYCQKFYTDLVAIQNKKEIEYLEINIPHNPTYYWIGIRKIKGLWTWVGTNKTLTAEATNWADLEPNNQKTTEDCVEIYIKRSPDAGKWNDDDCSKKKRALCYTASCNATTCSGHGECIETINNYTCSCDEGFFGFHCQHVVICEHFKDPPHGSVECEHSIENYSYGTACNFSCSQGWLLQGSGTTKCGPLGQWENMIPTCKAAKCEHLKAPTHGSVECPWTEFSYNTTCKFKCWEGWVLQGSVITTCGPSGKWSTMIPECKAAKCEHLEVPTNVSMECEHPFTEFNYNTTCKFKCWEGWVLQGSNTTTCGPLGLWDNIIPTCKPAKCEHFEAPTHGSLECKHSFTEFSYNTTCKFKCWEGWVLQGSNTTTCGPLGQWDNIIPTCKGETQFNHMPLNRGKTVITIGVATAGSMLISAIAVLFIMHRLKKAKRKKRSSQY
uniref:E-selectin n=1 Tax=Leptobrachium leishanense TaxID=445787 RepID=A0A8C5QSQ1_9ANUR